MPVLLALVALLLLTTYAPFSLYEEPVIPEHATIAFQAVPLDRDAPERRRLGALSYLGGWAIESNDPRFGGISAMHVNEREVLAVSDAGSLMRFSLPGRPHPRIEIGAIEEGPGRRVSKFNRDAESLVVHGRHAWIGFEYRKAIWRYRRGTWWSDAASAPAAMQDWPDNSGAEAMLRLADGSFLVFSEGKWRPDGSTEVLLFEGDPALPGTKVVQLGYRAPAGYRITDAALLPDGRMLFLNRRFTILEGFTAKLTLADPPALSAGSIIEGAEIADFRAPVIADNLEAISVRERGDRTIVWIASDDNFSGLQRTLLLKFALGGAAP